MDLIELIYSVPMFSSFSRDELAALEKMFSVHDYQDGHRFTQEGKRHNAVFLIVSGEVAVKKKRQTQTGYAELKRLQPGDVFGFVALIDKGAATATCQAVGAVRVGSAP